MTHWSVLHWPLPSRCKCFFASFTFRILASRNVRIYWSDLIFLLSFDFLFSHNIPEGLCIALPLFYATENRLKGFVWALVSGLSEPLASLVGWIILARFFSDMVYGILFGFVAGMMVIISTKELLPTAHKYDPDDKVTTNFFIVGMGIMSLSLILFVQTL